MEGLAKSDLQRANVAARSAESAMNESLAHYRQVNVQQGSSLLADHERATLAANAAIEAGEALAGARNEARVALDNYVMAARELAVLDRLDENRREEHAVAVLHEEAVVADEVASARFIARRARLEKESRRCE